MLKNYVKIAFRTLFRNKLYTFLNLAGLAIGIATTIFILLYVTDETSYDNFHTKKDRIYRISTIFDVNGKIEHAALTSAPQASTMAVDYPEIQEFVRLQPLFEKVLIEKDQKQIWVENTYFSDSTVFSVFDFELLKGDPEKALTEPNTVVISEDLAKKLFGNENPVGKTLKIDFQFNKSFQITGVMKNIPQNSHLKMDMLVSLMSFYVLSPEAFTQGWFHYQLYSYIVLPEGFDKAKLEAKFPEFHDKYIAEIGKKVNTKVSFELQPLQKLHFSHLEWEPGVPGNEKYVYIFSIVAIFILIIACINYMNLATALSESRNKEIGLRKVFGGVRSQLIMQFLVQSFILTVISLFFALILVELLLPAFNNFTGKSLSLLFFLQPKFLLILMGIVFIVGIVAGLYPALYLSKFNPIDTIRQRFKSGKRSITFRQVLVVLQFTISIVMIITTVIVFSQLNFMRNKDLGFNKERVMVLELPDTSMINNANFIKDEFRKLQQVESVATTNTIPGGMIPKQLLKAEQEGNMIDLGPDIVPVDYDYIEMMNVKVLKGRDFDESMGSDKKEAFIVNEKFVADMGWDDPIGKKMQWGLKQDGTFVKDGKVIGVVADFNLASLKQDVAPMVMMLVHQPAGQYLLVRLKKDNIASGLSAVEGVWKSIDAERPFEYRFLEEVINKQYEAEAKVGQLFTFFAMISILIACLGLFGLASFTVAKRRKEIGIRKVIGATERDIVMMINKDFLKLILISFLFAFPLAYYVMHVWLQDFAYRISIGWLPFFIAALAALIIAILTVSYQAIKAGISNPVKSLRHE